MTADDSMSIPTARLVLRRLTEADVDLLTALDAEPEVMRFLTGGKPTPRDVMRDERLPAMLAASAHDEILGFWAAFTRRGGDFIGWFELCPTASVGEAELGYRLHVRAWGQGYATEGAVELLRRGFDTAGLERVFATTMAVNLASRRVLERAGLTPVGIRHEVFDDPIEGTEHGEADYAVTRQEWNGPVSRPTAG